MAKCAGLRLVTSDSKDPAARVERPITDVDASGVQLQSVRSATAGSIRVARQAGPAIANVAVTSSRTMTDANVIGIRWLTPEQHRRQQPGEHRRQHQANDATDRHNASRAGHDEACHVTGRGAKRSPDTEVAHALLYGVGEDPEHADHRQCERPASQT